MAEEVSCGCGGGVKLIFACSGAADVGQISDLAARAMNRSGQGKMFCLAGIGAKIAGILKTTEAADRIVAIDGCPLECAKNSLEQAGFKRYEHVRLAEMGMEKSKSPVTADRISQAVAAAAAKLSS
jgi:uncharacterized metal-binding protein